MAQIPGLRLAWKGEGSDNDIWNSNCSGVNPLGLLVQVEGPGATSTRPAIASLPDLSKIMMTWKGLGSDTGVWWSIDLQNNKGWSPQKSTGFGTSWGPAVTAWKGLDFFMAWPGDPGDTRIWCSTFSHLTSSWSGQSLAVMPDNEAITTGIGVGVTSLTDGRLVMVWRGVGGNDNIYSAVSSDGLHWSQPASIPGAATAYPPAIVEFNSKVVVMWRGQTDDGLYSTVGAFNNQGQIGWNDVFHLSNSGSSHGPQAVVAGGQILMVWKGINNDTGIYWATSGSGVQWSEQEKMQNFATSVGPAVALA